MQRVDIMTHGFQNAGKTYGEVFVELDLHRIRGTAGTGRSSSAEAAAKAIAACRSSITGKARQRYFGVT
jgi:hypothetical protein